MKSKILFLVVIFLFTTLASNANSTFIETWASGWGDGTFTSEEYSYLFRINATDNTYKYKATLTNTSPYPSESLIDKLAFNMGADLGADFWIEDVEPNWTFDEGKNAVHFDYVGEANSNNPNNGDRLNPEYLYKYPSSLTFNFVFSENFTFPSNPFSLWIGTDLSRGIGIGGGDDWGQVAVRFQRLGVNGDYSDLLASNWIYEQNGGGGGGGEIPIPEPSTIILLGMGLAFFAWRGRKFFFK